MRIARSGLLLFLGLSSCVGEGSDFDSPVNVGARFVSTLADGHVERSNYYTCDGRAEAVAERGPSSPGRVTTPLAPGDGLGTADIVNDNPFGEPDPDGDVTLEGTVEEVPYVVVLTEFDDGLWCVTEATLDDDPIVTDGEMPLDQFE